MPEQSSCDPCRSTKVKCTKERPVCVRCQQRDLTCAYSQRKKWKPRRKKSEGTILDRVKRLEQQVTTTSPGPISPGGESSVLSPSQHISPPAQHISPISQHLSPVSPGSHGRNGHSSASHISQTLPVQLPRTPSISIMSELPQVIPRELTAKWMHSALTDSIYDKFLGLVDLNALSPIPSIIDSSYAKVDPRVATIFYFLINIGWHQDSPAEPYWGTVIYSHCIRDLPDWEHMEVFSDIDLAAIIVAIYIALEKFDLRMAWKLLLQSKRILDSLGIREMDAASTQHTEDISDERIESRRLAFGQIMRIDCLFRAFYGKPPVLMHENWSVHLPTAVINRAANPSDVTLATILVAFARIMLLVMESFSVLDDDDMAQRDIRSKMETYFWQTHEWIEEWKIEDAFHESNVVSEKRLLGDTLVFAWSLLVVWEQKMRGSRDLTRVVAREAARKVMRVFIELAELDRRLGSWSSRIALSVTVSGSFASFFYLFRLAHVDDSEANRQDRALLEDFSEQLLRGSQTYGYNKLQPLAEYMYRIVRTPEMGIESSIAGVPDPTKVRDWNASYAL